MNLQEYIKAEITNQIRKVSTLAELLEALPSELGSLESDSFAIYGGWLILRDDSHKDLGAKLATMTDQAPVFRDQGSTKSAKFQNVGPFYSVDLDRPNKHCRTVRVLRPSKEDIISICGSIPKGLIVLEELDEAPGT